MSAATWDQADIEARVAAEVQRLAGLSDYARRTAQRWWVKRLLQTAAHPGSAQHALACGVVDTLSRRTVSAVMRMTDPVVEAGHDDTA